MSASVRQPALKLAPRLRVVRGESAAAQLHDARNAKGCGSLTALLLLAVFNPQSNLGAGRGAARVGGLPGPCGVPQLDEAVLVRRCASVVRMVA